MTMLLSTPQATPQPYRPPRLPRADAAAVVRKRVSEVEYWENYYEDSDHHYEWNNGYLEEKGVSNYSTILMYDWFTRLLDQYLTAYPIAHKIMLEMGFRLTFPHHRSIRKPDFALIRHDNPVPIGPFDLTYQGVCDLCVEALSDSTQEQLERDTVTKKEEYARGGVTEYYILYSHDEEMAFYRRNRHGLYVPIKPVKGVIQSQVLPGFQFRRLDLYNRPSVLEMSHDKVYQGFVGLDLQAERQRAEAERRKVAEAKQKTAAAEHRAQVAEAKLQQLEAELARLRQRK